MLVLIAIKANNNEIIGNNIELGAKFAYVLNI